MVVVVVVLSGMSFECITDTVKITPSIIHELKYTYINNSGL